MKILQCGASLHDWGGIERYIAFLRGGLAERGHEVVVLAPPGSPLAQRTEAQTMRLRAKYDLVAWATFIRHFKTTRPDIAHVHFSPEFLAVGYAARVTRTRTVLTRHLALRWKSKKARLYAGLYDQIVPVSEIVRQRLLESGIPNAKLTVAKAGCPAMTPSSDAQLPDAFTVGCFGRLVPEKGVDLLIAAAQTTPEVQFEIYGEGPTRASLDANLPPNVHFRGFTQDVARAMSEVHVVAIPSRWEEAFPYSALEAMSLARPILAANIGGLPEMVVDGETGRLHEPESADDLAEKLRHMQSDLEGTTRMGERGQARHRDEFTVAHMAQRMEAVYAKVMA